MEASGQRPPPFSHLYAETRTYRLSRLALCVVVAVISSVTALAGWLLVGAHTNGPFGWSTVFLLVISLLSWVLYVEAPTCRANGLVICLATALVLSVSAVASSLLGVLIRRPFEWLDAYFLVISMLFWVPFALFFRARQVPLRFALLIGVTSPLLAGVALGAPYILGDPGLLLMLLRGAPAGLLTGYLVHRVAVGEGVRPSKAVGGV